MPPLAGAAVGLTDLGNAFHARTGNLPPHDARGIAPVPTFKGQRSNEDIDEGPEVVATVRALGPDGEEVDQPAGVAELSELLNRMKTGGWQEPALAHRHGPGRHRRQCAAEPVAAEGGGR